MIDLKSMLDRWADNLERNVRLISFVRNGIIDGGFKVDEQLTLALVRLDYVMSDLEAVAYSLRLKAEKVK